MPQSIGKLVRSWIWDFDALNYYWGLESLVLSTFLWCHRALANSWDLGFGILMPSITKCLTSLVLSMFLVILDVWFGILDFGVWNWRFGQRKQMSKKPEKNHEITKKEEQVHCLQGLILFYHRGKGPLGETLAIFFFGVLESDGKIQWTAQKT